jgi:hypothetical protein
MKLSPCEKNISGCRFFSTVCIAAAALVSVDSSCTQYDVTEHEIRQNQSADDSLTFLKDDSLSVLPSPVFDPSMEVFDMNAGCNINKSAAVFRLDVPGYDAAKEHALDKLYPSVSQAVTAASGNVLLSINVVGAKAKQFNDGPYAALDLSYYHGIDSVFSSHVSLVKALYQKLTNDTAKAFVAAGLTFSDSAAGGYDAGLADRFLSDYLSNEVRFKPIGFYTWNTELEKLFRFMRFFQKTFTWNGVVADIVSVLRSDSSLVIKARRVDWLYSGLTNPLSYVSMAELAQSDCELSQQGLMHTADSLIRSHRDETALFPPSTSVETELFNALYPEGVPPDADMMNELIKAIQNGTVDLTPKPETGWYGRQVYALETFLLPSKGEEHSKLLLSENYKKRLLEAFKAIITTQRETHVRQLEVSGSGDAIEQRFIPALRVEPGCTYFLRTALAYAFLKEFLESSVGRVALQSLHGLTEEGTRRDDLWSELEYMRALFHGLYLVSAEDIGMKPAQSPAGWPSVSDKSTAEVWLQTWLNDPDLAADARVAVPIYAGDSYTMMWGTLGIRLCHLYVAYAVPPRFRSVGGQNWNTLDSSACDTAKYLIPVLEFGEFRLSGKHVLTRQEFRSICDQNPTKEAIIRALQN